MRRRAMIERDLQSILDDAVRQLGELVDLERNPVSAVSAISSFQPENETLYRKGEIPDHNSPDPDPDFFPRKSNNGNGNYGNYGNSNWTAVSRLFPYLERGGDPRLFDHLIPDHPPGDVPLSRWQQFIADARGFVVSGWLDRAQSLGWTIEDLFGADDVKPYARIDRAGLVLLLNGNRVVAISADVAGIETQTGARQTYRRRGVSLINNHAEA